MKIKIYSQASFFIGLAVVLLVVLLIGSIFVILSQTDLAEIYLGDTSQESKGWEYEVLSENTVQTVEPQYTDEFTQGYPLKNISAIKITRTMTETIESAQITFSTWGLGIEVFLNGSLLYTQFPDAERGTDGFLMLDEQDFVPLQGDNSHDVALSLPSDYMWSRLMVITYFPADYAFDPSPAFPMLGNADMQAAPAVAGSVGPVAILTVSAMCVLLLAVIFLLSTRSGKADYKILLLIAFYLFLFLNRALISLPGTYSGLAGKVDANLFEWLYVTPLCVYIACRLTQWRRIGLLGAVAFQLVYGGAKGIVNYTQGYSLDTNYTGITVFIMLIIAALMACMEYIRKPQKMKRYVNVKYAALAILVLLVISLSESLDMGSLSGYYTAVFSSVLAGNFKPLARLLSMTFAVMTTVFLVVEFIRRTIETKNRADLLQTRSDMAMASYHMMRTASEHTRVAQHELKHHVVALKGMLEQNEAQKALQYMDNLSVAVDALPAVRYSDNLLVNTTVGAYLERAKREGISVKHSVTMPVSVGIEDSDLCVFLTNLLENAVEACLEQLAGQSRFLYLQIHQNGEFLLISCKNSIAKRVVADENGSFISTKKDHTRHGYGLGAMKLIAEKYGSVLKIDVTENEFVVKTNLHLQTVNHPA